MGKEVKDLKGYQLREFRKKLGMIFQGFNLLNRKTVFDNVAFPLEVWGFEEEYKEYRNNLGNKKSIGYRVYRKKRINERVNELLELVGLSEKAKVKPA
ncbi:methionine ABC transporter ATP-binding protein, partial [Clostridium sp. HCS.1]